MSRSRRPKKLKNRNHQRNTRSIAKRRRDVLMDIVKTDILRDDHVTRKADDFDRRRYDPDPYKIHDKWRYIEKPIRRANIAHKKKRHLVMDRDPVAYHKTYKEFINPEKAKICRQRSERRRQLFKKGKVGKGIAGPKFRNLTHSSEIVCTRRK